MILRLILPLGVLSAILIGLARPVSAGDVALNLATDLITIIVTVLYVDWVIRQRDKESWKKAEDFIASEAAAVGNAFIRDVAEALDIEGVLYPSPFSGDVQEIHAAILANTTSLDRLVIEDALAKLTRPRWQNLVAIVEARRADSTPITAQFAARLSAEQLSSILAFRRICSSILSSYSIFHDFLGVPVAKLPKLRGGKPEEYTVLTIIQLGIYFKSAFDASMGILSAFEYVIEPMPDNTAAMEASWARWYERTSKGRG